MSQRELLIILAHAQQCEQCRDRLLAEPKHVLIGRALTADEIGVLSGLSEADFLTPERLAKAAGVASSALTEYRDHPIVRLRHF